MGNQYSNIPEQEIDPVCQMKVSADSPYTYQYLGKNFHFCSENCLHKFQITPTKYLSPQTPAEERGVLDSATQYTCPMHPEVIQNHPGSCPKWGMALEPLITDLSAESEDPEISSRWLYCRHGG